MYLKRVGGGGRVKVGQNEYHDATANEEPVELQCAHIHTHTHMHSVLVFMYTHWILIKEHSDLDFWLEKKQNILDNT